MYQQSFQFVFLPEQLELDLDYSNCRKSTPIQVVTGSSALTIASTPSLTWTTTVKSNEVETSELVIMLDKRPNFVVRWLYKLLNIKWKLK